MDPRLLCWDGDGGGTTTKDGDCMPHTYMDDDGRIDRSIDQLINQFINGSTQNNRLTSKHSLRPSLPRRASPSRPSLLFQHPCEERRGNGGRPDVCRWTWGQGQVPESGSAAVAPLAAALVGGRSGGACGGVGRQHECGGGEW